jgi:hypothetical protein
MKYAIIFSVTAKSAIPPSFRGSMATIVAEVRPIMQLGRRSHCHNLFRLGIKGNDGGLGEDDALTLDGH